MPLSVSLPDPYRRVEGPGAWGFARPDAAPWAAAVLAAGGTFHAWAGAHSGRRALVGRGRTWAVPSPAPGSSQAHGWVVRHYRRGGLLARWLHDRYLAMGAPRPLAELRASLEASRRGIPTPAVVAGAVHPAAAIYRADLVTEEIQGGVDLAGVLFGDGGTSVDPLRALAAASDLVSTLAEAGVRHMDLNARNVVLQPRGVGVRAWLVDLDRCRFTAGPSPGAGLAMRRRLERSLRKLGAQNGRELREDAWAALASGPAASGSAPPEGTR
ncbi:MAG TPA: lipopolysaccharide kinase InaA family protein [Longimicrobiales bacterium]|nr:lipopolysaccharide kinase InaA family protein [Longimicrobiales bacterium]